jgi:cell division protein FtsQ
MPVTAPADRRFLRAQVKPGRRHRPWTVRLRTAARVAGALLTVAAAWRGTVMLADSRLLQVSHLTVTGNQRLSTGEVAALLGGLSGRGILTVDLDEWRRRVLACPWVEDATLRRWLPSTIEVVVTERYPIAVGRFGDELYLVDDHGAVIDEYGPRYADLDLPILDGLGDTPGQDPETTERRAALAARLLADLRPKPELAKRVSQVDVSDPHDAVVIVAGDTARLRLGEEHFVERLQSYFDLAPTIRESVPEVDYVDLRFGERVFVGSQADAVPAGAPAARRAAGVTNH